MENVLRPIYQEHASDPNTLGIVIIEKTKPNSPITDNFDIILLIIVKEADSKWEEKHYEFDDKTAGLHTVSEELFMEWIETSANRKAVQWVIDGKIVFDRNEYLASLKNQIRNFPHEKRDLRKALEFGKLVKSYSEVKDLYASEQYKDSYSRMVHCLHYLARLTVIEKGYHPEVTLWSQVRKIDPEVYKLYEELINSNEDIAKRLQLMILVADFAISTRAKVSAKHLLDTIDSEEDAWAYGDLKQHSKVAPYELDLTAMLNYLTEKGILMIEKVETKGVGIYQRKYRVNQEV